MEVKDHYTIVAVSLRFSSLSGSAVPIQSVLYFVRMVACYGARTQKFAWQDGFHLSSPTLLSMPSIIQGAFFLEALVNIPVIITLIFYPKLILLPALATNSISPALELNRTTTLLARCFGVIVLALSLGLLLAVPDSKDCVGKRKWVYWTVGLVEAGLIPLLLWEAFRTRGTEDLGGFTQSAALLCAGFMAPVLTWRVFVLGWKDNWLRPESGREGKKRV